MKKLFVALIALCASVAFGATTLPVQLINPTGSTSGQAIVSTGASSAPAWGGVSVASITGLGTGVGTALGAAVTGSGSIVLGTSPTITTPNITGVVSGACASSGNLGECLTATSSATSLTSSSPLGVATITLTAGDWIVFGSGQYSAGGATTTTQIEVGINTSSSALPAVPLYSGGNASYPTAMFYTLPAPQRVFNVTTSTPLWLVCQGVFAAGTATCLGTITAIRYH